MLKGHFKLGKSYPCSPDQLQQALTVHAGEEVIHGIQGTASGGGFRICGQHPRCVLEGGIIKRQLA